MTTLATSAFRFQRFSSISLAGVALVLWPPALAQTIDLAEGILNGQPLCEMTIDDLADELGRPSAVDSERSIGNTPSFGPTIYYHQHGLRANFPHSAEPPQTIAAATFYMSETWDADHSEHYQPASFDFASGANLDWRTDDTLAAYDVLEPRDYTPEMGKADYEEAGLVDTLGPRDDFMHIVDFRVEDNFIRFHHEPTTRYLEFVTYACNVDQ